MFWICFVYVNEFINGGPKDKYQKALLSRVGLKVSQVSRDDYVFSIISNRKFKCGASSVKWISLISLTTVEINYAAMTTFWEVKLLISNFSQMFNIEDC